MKLYRMMCKAVTVAIAIALVLIAGGPQVVAQTTISSPTGGNAPTVRICGVPGLPTASFGPQQCVIASLNSPGSPSSDGGALVAANGQLADIRQKLDSLQASINALKASNDAVAQANQDIAKKIHDENTMFNEDLTKAIFAKLSNYPADFVKSPAYAQLKQELVDMIEKKLGTPAPAGSQAAPPAAANK
jgi:hypothetical protein